MLWLDDAQREAFAGFRVPPDEQHERAIDDIPGAELENAMRWLLRQHQALHGEDLARETARCFGIQRLGSVVREVMVAVLDRLAERGDCELDGDTVRLPRS